MFLFSLFVEMLLRIFWYLALEMKLSWVFLKRGPAIDELLEGDSGSERRKVVEMELLFGEDIMRGLVDFLNFEKVEEFEESLV